MGYGGERGREEGKKKATGREEKSREERAKVTSSGDRWKEREHRLEKAGYLFP